MTTRKPRIRRRVRKLTGKKVPFQISKPEKKQRKYKKRKRIFWGQEQGPAKPLRIKFKKKPCPNCGTPWGAPHYSDTAEVCPIEECSICGGRLDVCGHKGDIRVPEWGPWTKDVKYITKDDIFNDPDIIIVKAMGYRGEE